MNDLDAVNYMPTRHNDLRSTIRNSEFPMLYETSFDYVDGEVLMRLC